jgi:hypothetical protein
VQDPEGNLLRYSLEDAASKVGVSKKSLDDYLLQLRFGKKFGFDFQKHKDDKVGVLRTFVKTEKSKNKGSGKDNKKGGGATKGVHKRGVGKKKGDDDDDEDDDLDDDEEEDDNDDMDDDE